MREEYALSILENKMLRKVVGTKKVEIIGGWGNLYNGKLQGVYRWQYYCGDHVMEDDTDEACVAQSRELKSVQDFVGNLKESARSVEPRCWRKNNI